VNETYFPKTGVNECKLVIEDKLYIILPSFIKWTLLETKPEDVLYS